LCPSDVQDIAAVVGASQPTPNHAPACPEPYCFFVHLNVCDPRFTSLSAGNSRERYTSGTMVNTNLFKGQLIRPIIPLCRPEEWSEKLWQPDANHRKQEAKTLKVCQLT